MSENGDTISAFEMRKGVNLHRFNYFILYVYNMKTLKNGKNVNKILNKTLKNIKLKKQSIWFYDNQKVETVPLKPYKYLLNVILYIIFK